MKKLHPQSEQALKSNLQEQTGSTEAQSGENLEPPEQESNQAEKQKPIGFFSVVGSVLAALLGIQSDKNRQRDFQQSSATSFIVVGIILVIGLVITMVVIVNSVISSSAGQ